MSVSESTVSPQDDDKYRNIPDFLKKVLEEADKNREIENQGIFGIKVNIMRKKPNPRKKEDMPTPERERHGTDTDDDNEGSGTDELDIPDTEDKGEVSKVESNKETYYLSNRSEFIDFINERFKNAMEKYEEKDKGNKLQMQQQLVTTYLNLDTPYRGLLLYHGLGSGKTISSIAVAEGIESFKNKNKNKNIEGKDKNIVVIGPLQLEQNFSNEVNKYYEKMNLKLGDDYDVPYYGYTSSKRIKELANIDMNNKIIIIDEVHNFSNRILNALMNNKSNKSSGASEKPNDVLRIYEKMKEATGSRFVLLSGTPVVNKPVELAIIFNILRGYIITYEYTFPFPIKKKSNKKEGELNELKNNLKKNHEIDFFDIVQKSKKESTYTVIVTQNPSMPYTFMNKNDDDVYKKIKSTQKIDNNFSGKVKDVIEEFLGQKGVNNKEVTLETKRYTALPEDEEEFTKMFNFIIKDYSGKDAEAEKDKGKLDQQKAIFKRRIIGLASYFKKVANMAEIEEKYVELEMSDFQKNRYSEEVKKEKGSKNRKGEITDKSYRVFTRQTCDFALPNECYSIIKKKKEGNEEEEKDEKDEEDEGEDNVAEAAKEPKGSDGKKVLNCIEDIITGDKKKVANKDFLTLDPSEDKEFNELETYSPKYKRILVEMNNTDNKGLHLIYSGFVIRGAEILGIVLRQNGFVELTLKEVRSKVTIDDIDIVTNNKSKVFILYRTSDSAAIKEAKRHIYNNSWGDLSDTQYSELKDQLNQLKEINNADQKYGDIVKAMIITRSSAEGISLNNTRFVHIIDPYWNPSVTQQVIGRARRFGSHDSLPVDEQKITVYKYYMRFGDNNQKKTTDEILIELSESKQKVMNKFLTLIKSASVDCRVYKDIHKDERYSCVKFEDNQWTFLPNIEDEKKTKR